MAKKNGNGSVKQKELYTMLSGVYAVILAVFVISNPTDGFSETTLLLIILVLMITSGYKTWKLSKKN